MAETFEPFASDWLDGARQEGALINHQCDSYVEVIMPLNLPPENIARAAICAYAAAMPRAGGYHITTSLGGNVVIKIFSSDETDWPREDPRSLKPGEAILVLTGPRIKLWNQRLVFVTEVYLGSDGEWWIKANWPGVNTEAELETNRKLEANGLKVDPDQHYVEGPASKFVW